MHFLCLQVTVQLQETLSVSSSYLLQWWTQVRNGQPQPLQPQWWTLMDYLNNNNIINEHQLLLLLKSIIVTDR